MSALIECGSIYHKRCDEHTKNSVRHSQAGFTLIEAMIVVVIMGVLLVIAAPSIEIQLQKQRNKQTSETIVSALREARTESLLRRQDIVLVPSDSSIALRLNAVSGTVLRQYNFPIKAPATFAGGNITFRSNKTVGFANATGNSVVITTYCDKDKTSAGRKVNIDNNGNIKLVMEDSSC